MITYIENWIDRTLDNYSGQKQSCGLLFEHFKDYYPLDFLQKSYFVVVKDIPKPDHPSLRKAGFGDFLDKEMDGITYKNTYFLKSGKEQILSLHFHELVHVLQWNILGARGFINRYISEINQFTYDKAPLEKMAYYLDNQYSINRKPINIPQYVSQRI